MTIPEILKELEIYNGKLPREALQAAIEQREAITPELLRILGEIAENPMPFAERQDSMLPVFVLYLLAQFREKRACPLIAKMLGSPYDADDDTVYELLGETVSEGLYRILASVYDGNSTPLREIIENDEIDEYVRSSALRTIPVLVVLGLIPRDEAIGYIRDLFHGRIEKEASFVWDELVSVVAGLRALEFVEDVRKAYADNLADCGVRTFEDFEEDVAAPMPIMKEDDFYITDMICEMEGWGAFSDEAVEAWSDSPSPVSSAQLPPDIEYQPKPAPRPIIRGPKIGRNDPCPCGSGKKYKKCCGNG